MKDFQVSKFSNFFSVGIDHAKANVKIREQFTLNQEQASHLIYEYKQQGGDGIMVLATCNRTEIYAFGNCPRNIIALFCKYTGTSQELFDAHKTIKQNTEAIEHLFRVGAGLESKILGDFEIIGQIKKSFRLAKDLNASNGFLERLVNNTVECSKRVKNETELSTGAASVAFAAVLQLKEYLKSNPQPKVLLIGLGKMGQTTSENLINQTGVKDITLVNRTAEKAERLANRFGVKHKGIEDLDFELNAADVVIVATGSDKPTVEAKHFGTPKERLLLDLSMPRNISLELYNAPNFKVVDVDQLSEVAQESINNRKAQIPVAETIINEKLLEFFQWLESRKVAPTLHLMREKLDEWKSRELELVAKKFPEIDPLQAEAFASQILNRISGQFARKLKAGSADLNSDLRTIHHIFELNN
jgi:glutamyl-tRNA reductase